MEIIHAHIKTMDGHEYQDGFVSFENGVITAIGPMSDAPGMPGGA